ncbi:MAG: ribonuclease Y [Candidatus Hydrogenedentota bacterium]
MDIVLCLAGFVVGVLLGAVVTIVGARLRGSSLVSKAKRDADQVLTDAERDAASIRKDAKTEVKELEIELRAQLEKEGREQRKELAGVEKRLAAKEESLDKRAEGLDSKASDLNAQERDLVHREKAVEIEKDKVAEVIAQQTERLEAIAGMTADQARKELFHNLETEVKRDGALQLKKIEEELKENAEKKARWVIGEAIQRCAADHVAESTVSVVNLPNDEMKGRIIGREGRNIRALESATGINVIIDDTPEAVILSGFDPIRREVARVTLERLVQDGRIHPARIEEMVEKVNDEISQTIKERGEQAALEADVHGLHHEIIKLIGRLSFRTSYGQNVLRHSLEVCNLCAVMAAELGVNVQEAKRAGLIHDMGKALTHEKEGSHAVLGHDLAKRYGESETVSNAVGAHHAEMPMNTLLAMLVQAADAMSAARPGARSENMQHYIKRLEQLEDIAETFPGVEKSYALQAGREVRIVVEPNRISDAEASVLARDVAHKVEAEMTYPGEIKVTVVRETRAVEVAK